MATAMMAALALLAQDPAASTPPIEQTLQDVLIIGRGDPLALPDAGTIAPYLAVEGLTPEGPRVMLYLLRMGPYDPAPPVGSTCTVQIAWEPLLGGSAVATPRGGSAPQLGEPVANVRHFDCRITSTSPAIGPEGIANP